MTNEEFILEIAEEKIEKLSTELFKAQRKNEIYRELLEDIYESLDDVVAIRELFEKWNDEVDF